MSAYYLLFPEWLRRLFENLPCSEELAEEMRLAAAAKWYEMGMISQERAAQLSGMGRSAFIDALSRLGFSPSQETAEEILDALDEDGPMTW